MEVADNAVLTSGDVPGFESHATTEAALPATPECRGLERARKQLRAAPNRHVEFRTRSESQDIDNKVGVLTSTKRAQQILRAYERPEAAA